MLDGTDDRVGLFDGFRLEHLGVVAHLGGEGGNSWGGNEQAGGHGDGDPAQAGL